MDDEKNAAAETNQTPKKGFWGRNGGPMLALGIIFATAALVNGVNANELARGFDEKLKGLSDSAVSSVKPEAGKCFYVSAATESRVVFNQYQGSPFWQGLESTFLPTGRTAPLKAYGLGSLPVFEKADCSALDQSKRLTADEAAAQIRAGVDKVGAAGQDIPASARGYITQTEKPKTPVNAP